MPALKSEETQHWLKFPCLSVGHPAASHSIAVRVFFSFSPIAPALSLRAEGSDLKRRYGSESEKVGG